MTDQIKQYVDNLRGNATFQYCSECYFSDGCNDSCKENCLFLRLADVLESTSEKLDQATALADARLQRKNMYKERSERDFFMRKGFEFELRHVKHERDSAVEIVKKIGGCHYCANKSFCDDDDNADCTSCTLEHCPCYSCYNHNKWQWCGIKEK